MFFPDSLIKWELHRWTNRTVSIAWAKFWHRPIVRDQSGHDSSETKTKQNEKRVSSQGNHDTFLSYLNLILCIVRNT